MEQLEQIPIGQQDNDGTGDPLRNGMAKVNANFTKVQTGVDAVELTAANAAQTATEAKTTADAAIPAAQKGMAGGVAPLDETGKVPATHLPELADYIPVEEKGAAEGVAPLDAGTKVPVANLPVGTAGGVAPLGADGKVPAINLPAAEDSIPLSQKGQPGGVAPLDSVGKVPVSHIPDLGEFIPLDQKGAPGGVASLDGEGAVPASQLSKILEVGSNASGVYYKFSSGDMICFIRVPVTGVIWTAGTPSYAQITGITLPAAFVAAPLLVGMTAIDSDVSGRSAYLSAVLSVTTTIFSAYVSTAKSSPPAGGTITVTGTAIGRWKA